MSGTNTNLNWLYSYTTPQPDKTYTLRGENVIVSLGTTGSSNYRVYGFEAVTAPPVGSAVPEPATWALCIGGFGLVGGTLRPAAARGGLRGRRRSGDVGDNRAPAHAPGRPAPDGPGGRAGRR